LFVIAILAVLVGAISSGSGGFGSTSKERATLLAGQIIAQFEQMRLATMKVSQNGCLDSQISFENFSDTSYVNASAPGSGVCNVFGVFGGTALYKPPPRETIDWQTTAGSYVAWRGRYAFQNIRHSGKPTVATYVGKVDWCPPPSEPCGDFLAHLPYVTKTVCMAINDLANVDNPSGSPPLTNYGISINRWNGTNTNGTQWTIVSTENRPILTACIEGNGANAGTYHAFSVLLIR